MDRLMTEPALTAPIFATLTVSAVEHDTRNSVTVTLETDGDNRFRFAHGQHLTFRRMFDDIEIRRSYSICAPSPDGQLRVGIKRVEGGVFSTWATTELEAGVELDVMTPTGHFTHDLVSTSARRYALVAAGSGITPVYSIAATILAEEPASVVSLVCVNQNSNSIMLLDDIEALRNRYLGRVQIWNVLTQEATEIPLLEGRPDADRLGAMIHAGILPAEPDHVFVCGPEGLVANVRNAYLAVGTEADVIHDELFTSSQVGQLSTAPQIIEQGEQPIGTGYAILHGRATGFDIYQGDTVLDAAQRTRPDAPFSCRSGICSTCRAHLVEGVVEMNVTHGLVAGEEQAGYILTCQAFAKTSNVRVDFDR
jgi:ring-1,2-phenylacetyl-CoA epoxidase subunit PaaE